MLLGTCCISFSGIDMLWKVWGREGLHGKSGLIFKPDTVIINHQLEFSGTMDMRKGHTNMRFCLIAYPQKPLIIAQSAMPRGTRCLKVVWCLLQLAYFDYARSKNPGEVMRTCRLVGASATGRCNKNQHLVCWPIYSTFVQRKCD